MATENKPQHLNPKTTNSKPNQNLQKVIIGILIFGLIFFGISLTIFLRNRNEKSDVTSTDNSNSSQISSSSSSQETKQIDLVGLEIRNQLKTVQGLDMGFIYSDTLKSLNMKDPVKLADPDKKLTTEDLKEMGYPTAPRLADLVAKPVKPEQTNLLSFPAYKINAPLVYASFQDMFESDTNGLVDFNKPIQEDPKEIARGNYESVPVQKLLKNGIVHLPFSTYPGEIGNSYIIGHSSNFSAVKSDYNTVFAPIEQKSKVGDEFFIYDQDGRKLTFKVFEVKAVREDDITESYKNYTDRRVVTLQASILERVDGILQPTKRWLTRGELVVENNVISSSNSDTNSSKKP